MPEFEDEIKEDEELQYEENENDNSVSSDEELSNSQKEQIKRETERILQQDEELSFEGLDDTIEESSETLQRDQIQLSLMPNSEDSHSVWDAAQRQYNSTVSLFNNVSLQSMLHFESEEEKERRKELKISQEEMDKQIIADAPWYKSISASAIAGMSDPLTWAATLGAGMLAVSFGLPALAATVFIGASAAFINAEIRYGTQETMDMIDVVTETAAGAFFSAVLHDTPAIKNMVKDDIKSLSTKIKTCFQPSTFDKSGTIEHIADQTFHKPSKWIQKISLNSPINKLNFSGIGQVEELSQIFFRAEHLGDPRLQEGLSRLPSIEQRINLQQHKTLDANASYIENFYTGVLGAEIVSQDKSLKFLRTELGAPIEIRGGRKGTQALYDKYAYDVWESIITGSKKEHHGEHISRSAKILSKRINDIQQEGVDIHLFEKIHEQPVVETPVVQPTETVTQPTVVTPVNQPVVEEQLKSAIDGSNPMPGFWYGAEDYGPMYYFPRMWNKSKVIERREELQKLFEEAILSEYLQTGNFDNLYEVGFRLRLEKDKGSNSLLPSEIKPYIKKKEYRKVLIKNELNKKSKTAIPLKDLAREKARMQIDHIISSGDWTDNQHNHVSSLTSGGGKIHDRTVKIHDMLLRDFLVTDPAVILQRKGGSMANQVEVLRGIKQAGYVDWEDLCTSTDKILERSTKSNKITTKKEIEYRELIRDLPALVTGAYGRFNTISGARANIIAKAMQAWIHATKLGGVALSCITDPAVLVYNYGIKRVLNAYKTKAISFFSGEDTAFKVNSRDIHNFGTALEMAVKSESSRIEQGHNIEDIAIGKSFNRLSKMSDKLNEFTFKYTGLNSIVNMHANLTETLFADELMKTILKKNLTNEDKKFLSRHYIPIYRVESLKKEIIKNSKNYDGLLVPELYKWENQNAKDLMQMAIQTASYNTVLKPSRGEIPRWMIKYGRFGTMYTSYIISLHQHVTLLMAQGETGRRASTIVSMLALATAADYLKQLKRGKDYEFNPIRVIEETGVGHIYLKPVIEMGGFSAGVTGIMKKENKSYRTGPDMLGNIAAEYSAPFKFISEITGLFSDRKDVVLRSIKGITPGANFIGVDSLINNWIEDATKHRRIKRRR